MSVPMSLLDHAQVLKNSHDEVNQALRTVPSAGALITEKYDSQIIEYVASGNGSGEISRVTYKLGGLSGTTVAILDLSYDSSNRLTGVTKS